MSIRWSFRPACTGDLPVVVRIASTNYAIHAEQAAILEAVRSGDDVAGAEIFVIGSVQRGANKGALSVRASDGDYAFSCVRCARTRARFGVAVNIPLPSGWHRLTPEGALAFREQKRSPSASRSESGSSHPPPRTSERAGRRGQRQRAPAAAASYSQGWGLSRRARASQRSASEAKPAGLPL